MNINLHISHPSAFISSTFLDLEQERRAVAKTLRESGLLINALDIKPASNESSRKEILNGIKESDFIILIVGERYGSIIPKLTLSTKLSITRWEYDQAVNHQNKHVLVYFKKVNSRDPIYYDDPTAPDYTEKRQHLQQFKNLLSDKHNPKYFSTPDDLAEEIRTAIIPTYRNGVRSLARINERLSKKIEALEKEIETLKNPLKPADSHLASPKHVVRGLSNPPNQLGRGLINRKPSDSNKT